jgi:hypothetical protein
MKIVKIEEFSRQDGTIFNVFFKPTLFEKLIGCKEKVKRFKDSGCMYVRGENTVYIQENGSYLENHSYIGETIDNWRRKF